MRATDRLLGNVCAGTFGCGHCKPLRGNTNIPFYLENLMGIVNLVSVGSDRYQTESTICFGGDVTEVSSPRKVVTCNELFESPTSQTIQL